MIGFIKNVVDKDLFCVFIYVFLICFIGIRMIVLIIINIMIIIVFLLNVFLLREDLVEDW